MRTPSSFANRSLSIATCAWLALAGLSGCDPGDVDQIAGDVRDAPSAPAGTSITFEALTDEVGARADTETRAVVHTAQGYRDFFGHLPPAGVDFSRQWVIFYAAGTKPSGGHETRIISVTRSDRSLVVITGLTSPGAGCVVTDALTAPYVLVKIPVQPGVSITFLKRDAVRDCDPPTSPCATVLCAVGTHCEAQEVQCIRAPCPPVAVCVPDAAVVRCGGIAGIACPGAGKCVDDPSDSCDPNAGGADCGGICQCVQSVLCVKGTVFDGSPAVCACVPSSTCGPVCAIFCQFGNVLDAQGCPTCACNPPPPDAKN
jgi:hypothetical protein